MALLSERAVQLVFDRMAVGASLPEAVGSVADQLDREQARPAEARTRHNFDPLVIRNHRAWCVACQVDADAVDHLLRLAMAPR